MEPPAAAAPDNLQPPTNYGGARPKSAARKDRARRHATRGNRHGCKKSSGFEDDKKPTMMTDHDIEEFSRIMSESIKSFVDKSKEDKKKSSDEDSD